MPFAVTISIQFSSAATLVQFAVMDSKKSFLFENWEDIGSLSRSSSLSLASQPTNEKNCLNRQLDAPKREPAQPTDIVFRLNWSLRDELIANLSQHSHILLGKTMQTSDREKMRAKNFELLTVVLELPLQAVDCDPLADAKEVVLDLDEHIRARIVSNLSLNHNLSLLHLELLGDEKRATMLRQNRELTGDLWNLPVRVIEHANRSNDDKIVDNTVVDPTTVDKAANEIDLLRSQVKNMQTLELEMEEIREKMKSLDFYKKDAKLIHEFGDLKTFLETGVGDHRSATFYCRG